MITPANIIDEQIRKLRSSLLDRVDRGVDTIDDRAAIELCDGALDTPPGEIGRAFARARCAEILNEALSVQIRDLRDNGPRTTDVLNECDLALAALRGEFGAGPRRAELALARCLTMLDDRAARAAAASKESAQ